MTNTYKLPVSKRYKTGLKSIVLLSVEKTHGISKQ